RQIGRSPVRNRRLPVRSQRRDGTDQGIGPRSEERRVGKECTKVRRPTALKSAILNSRSFDEAKDKISTGFCEEYLLCPKRIWASATPAKRSKNIIFFFFKQKTAYEIFT